MEIRIYNDIIWFDNILWLYFMIDYEIVVKKNIYRGDKFVFWKSGFYVNNYM